MLTPVRFFKCLGDETRLNMTLLIAKEGELCVCELMAALKESQPKISRHLAQLRNSGVLEDVRRGQWVFYSLAKTLPDWARKTVTSVSQSSTDPLHTLQSNLAAMENRPQCG